MKRGTVFMQEFLGRALRQNSLGQKNAFTMVELMIVIAIMSVLAGLLLPALNRAWGRANIAKCSTTIGSLQTALAMYSLDYGLYPPSSDAEGSQHNGNSADADHFAPGTDEPENFVNALTATSLGGPYMEFKGKDLDESVSGLPVLLDPWGQAYIYTARRRSTTESPAANNLVVDTQAPFFPYTTNTDNNTYNIYSLGPDRITNGGVSYSDAGGGDWNLSTMYDGGDDGHWNSTTNESDGQYDDINSWDGARGG